MFLQETYVLEDCLLYTSSVSNTFGSTFGFYNIYDLNGVDNYEITCKLSANKTKGLAVALHQNNNDTNSNIIRGGYEGGNINSIACLNPSYSSTNEWTNSETYTTGSDRPILIRKDSNGIYVKVNDVNSHTITSYPSNLRYFGMESWNNSKTVTVKEIKIKAL